jgi:hypothetical protein
MEDQSVPGPAPDAETEADQPEVDPQTDDPSARPEDEGTTRSGTRPPKILQPAEALERLDRQWDDLSPLASRTEPIISLALTTSADPRGWDYLGALTGEPADEVARACEAWLEAQLAADAETLGQAIRPRVELVPAGRLWFVVRTVASLILVIDGPGYLTPRAAAVAASRRYEAELVRALEAADAPDTAPATSEAEAADAGEHPPGTGDDASS